MVHKHTKCLLAKNRQRQDQRTAGHAPSVHDRRQAQEYTMAWTSALCIGLSGKHETPDQPESLVMTADQPPV